MKLTQSQALALGRLKRQRLIEIVKRTLEFDHDDQYPNVYLYSSPGLGKTHIVKELLDRNNVTHYVVCGNNSLFAFGIQLAVIAYHNLFEPVVVLVDDCDELLKDTIGCNIMKNVLEGDKKYVYEKALTTQMLNLSELQLAAVEYFKQEGKMGFSIPTDKMKFIFTSNIKLPTDDFVQKIREKKSGSTMSVMIHRNAIRSRCTVADFELTKEEHWGWLADAVQTTEILGNTTSLEKNEYLDFLWSYWDNLSERSLRTIHKMKDIKRKYPERYLELWTIDLLKSN